MTRVLPIIALVLVCLACMTHGDEGFEKPVQDAPDEGGLKTAFQTVKEKLQDAGAYVEESFHQHVKPAFEQTGTWFRDSWDKFTSKVKDTFAKDEEQ